MGTFYILMVMSNKARKHKHSTLHCHLQPITKMFKDYFLGISLDVCIHTSIDLMKGHVLKCA